MQVQTESTRATQAPSLNLYEVVTNKIISIIEQGVAPWRITWNQYGLARNYATGHIYTGINMILMNNTLHHYPFFMTYNQVKDKGGTVRKGAKAEMVIYFNLFFKDSNDQTLSREQAAMRSSNGEEIQVLKFIKYYNVFNLSDIEGIDFKIEGIELKQNEKIERCERILWEMPNPPGLKSIDRDNAFYSPKHDFINMPAIEQFKSPEAYYATLFHELIHSTGHASRLAREEVMNVQAFGSSSYSKEEIVAEMGASFLCSVAQVDYDSITENSAAYLHGWLEILREDSKFVFKAASDAQKAVDYILRQKKEESG